ncbi:hypothetical protein PBY51_017230 [Eleginops maclovinus]|uniref:Tumor necrosis factor receptor superfamily member 1A n=2 Tax=Eleginops maclovinus TaxID=56733 RepID=A0AAN7XJF5_ELEMC|nr:hypothetical protein PBY51_017230 [Eleginops maclovinus]
MCMFNLALTLVDEGQNCKEGEFLSDNGVCCTKCNPGLRLVKACDSAHSRTNCTQCAPGYYTENSNFAENCRSCRKCQDREEEVSKCKTTKNRVCRCKEGYYRSKIDSVKYQCLNCSKCGQDQMERKTCTPEQNTVCECKETFYKVNAKCEPCESCTHGCQHLCFSTPVKTTAPEQRNEHLINIIAGVAALSLVSMGLVFLVTYLVTKRSIKKKMLKQSSQESDISVESGKPFLNFIVEPAENRIDKALPQTAVSEQEPPNLPDCVPLEVKIPELIYTVLDLVPVLQVKQLVRTLGVTDTEIEQAEADHRSCREAHYQMLKVWAKRGARSGGGGRGRMVHEPLLQELLGQLRQMHLGRAAEELETKYSIE